MASPVILVEAQPRSAADGSSVTVRLAGGGAALPFTYSGAHWRAGIAGLPTIITSIDFGGADLGTGGVPQAAEIVWAPPSQDDVAELAAYFWGDAPITVRIGPEGPLPPVVLSGKVLAATVEDGRLKLALADPAAALKKPLLTARYAGTGGLEGPVEWEGRIKRRVWGRVFNQPGEPIDKAHNIYCYGDPLQPLQEIVTVRDKGATAAALTSVAWAGTAAATLAALQAAVAPDGGGVVCPSIACVKWWTQPAGDLHADLKGEAGAGYVETTAAIAERLVQVIGGPGFAAGTVAAAIAARPAPVGWTARDENATVSAMLDELLGNSSLLWVLDAAGAIVLREWAWGASVAAGESHSAKREEGWPPVATRKIGYQRNEAPMARGDIAAAVLASDVSLSGGGQVETALADLAVSIDAATAAIAGPALISIAADYTGVVTATLPRTVPFTLLRNADDLTTSASWSVTVLSGTIAASIGAADGVLSLDASGGVLTSATARLAADLDGTLRYFDVKVTKDLAPPPSNGGGGSGSAGSVGGSLAGSSGSTSMSPIGDELTVVVGSGGQVTLSASYTFDTALVSGSQGVSAEWRQWDGSAYIALGSPVPALAAYVPSTGEQGYGECGLTVSGLTAASTEKFQVWMKNTGGSTGIARNISGSCSAVGS